jgi:cytochrome P450
VANPDHHADGKILQIFKKLLADKPVWWNPIGQDDGFWAVGGYDAVSHVLKHPDIFSADVKKWRQPDL